MKILADASLPHLDDLFNTHFKLTRYSNQQMLHDALPDQDALLCRSTLKITPELLNNTRIQCIATASSGIDHIDTDYLSTQNIQLFDAKGCNAEAVRDYVLATLAYLKKNNLLHGRRVGVMGAGEVGSRVIQCLEQLGFEVYAYDPLKPHFNSCSFDAFRRCDILCIHANLHNTHPYPSKNSLDAEFFSQLAPNTILINAARGGIIDEAALLNAQKNIIYCTDVYQNEPEISPQIIQHATLCTPHIAGHSIEAKSHAVLHLGQLLHAHFHFKMPHPIQIQKTKPSHSHLPNAWDEFILGLYNPLVETQALKQASDYKTTFLTLRRAHTHRHHFNLI